MKNSKFHEPWIARAVPASTAWIGPPPAPEHYSDSEKRQWNADWENKNIKETRDRPWLCLGSNMSPPRISFSLTGKPVVVDDHEIILAVTKHASWPQGSASHSEIAKRVAACVSAMAGIHDPEEFMRDYHERNDEQ